MSTPNVQFLEGINRHDVKSLRQVIRNTEQRMETTKGLGFNQREQVRRENEAARVFEEQASKNQIVKDLLERIFEAHKYPDGELLEVIEWFVTAVEAASSFQPGTDLYQQAVTAYGKALDDHGSEVCRSRPVIKWPRQSPAHLAKVSSPRINLNLKMYGGTKGDVTDSVEHSDNDPGGNTDEECSVSTRQSRSAYFYVSPIRLQFRHLRRSSIAK